jgi:6-phosphogluconate dehydrogenase (decarboxylating)
MVHNGIEYADMQLIAEAYDLLRNAIGLMPAEAAQTFRQWNTGRLDSYLIEITAEVLAHTDQTTGKPFVDIVLDQAEQKGTGRWTVQDALDLGVPVNGIAEAVFARSLSGHADLRRAARSLPGPKTQETKPAEFADQVEQALYASKLVSYAQGWHMMDVGSREYGWDLDLGTMATIWRGGCIIRAVFLDRIRAAYEGNAELPTLLADEEFGKELAAAQDAWRNVVATAARLGIPAPGFSAALAYYDALRAERLPAALVQGLRDYFGAHTYRRTDRDGTFHTLWAAGRAEEERLSRTTLGASVPEQAERMPGRIEADSHVVLGLELRERGALGDRVRRGLFQVIDLDLQVHHHLLVAGRGRPDRGRVLGFGLEVQRQAAAGRPEDHPVGLLDSRGPAEQPPVEVRERVGVGGVDVDAGDRQAWLWHVTDLPVMPLGNRPSRGPVP